MSLNQKPALLPRRSSRVEFAVWLAALLVLWTARPAIGADEPKHAGKPLSFWLHQLDETKRFNWNTHAYEIDPDAAKAVWEIGEAAVPFLMDHLRAGLAANKEYEEKAHGLSPEEQRRMMDKSVPAAEAALGFQALRERGSAAVPALTELMWQEEIPGWWITDPLAYIGSPSVPTFIRALTSTNVAQRRPAALAAGLMGDHGVPLVPLLIRLLTNSESGIERAFAAQSLGRIGKPVGTILPVLCEELSSTDETVADNVCLGLMLMGTNAEPAIPRIESRLRTRAGEPDIAMISGFIVLCHDDKRVVATLEKNFQLKSSTFAEVISIVRQSWNQPTSRELRNPRLEALKRIQPASNRE